MNVLGPLGYNHTCVQLIDTAMVRQPGNFDVPQVPTVAEQLQLMHELVLPHLRGRTPAQAEA